MISTTTITKTQQKGEVFAACLLHFARFDTRARFKYPAATPTQILILIGATNHCNLVFCRCRDDSNTAMNPPMILEHHWNWIAYIENVQITKTSVEPLKTFENVQITETSKLSAVQPWDINLFYNLLMVATFNFDWLIEGKDSVATFVQVFWNSHIYSHIWQSFLVFTRMAKFSGIHTYMAKYSHTWQSCWKPLKTLVSNQWNQDSKVKSLLQPSNGRPVQPSQPAVICSDHILLGLSPNDNLLKTRSFWSVKLNLQI